MNWKWFAAGLAALLIYLAAEAISSAVVLGRVAGLQEVLVAPGGARLPVFKPADIGAQAPRGAARVLGGAGVAFGYRMTYATPDGSRVVCTHRITGAGCEDGWAIIVGEAE